MNNQDIQTKIDNYLLKRMTEAERQDLETEMATDSKLKESVELQRLLVTEIQQRAFISEIIEETEKRMVEEGTKEVSIPFQKPIPDVAAFIPPTTEIPLPPGASKTFSFRNIMMATWSAAAIFIGVFFVNSAMQNSRMDNISTKYSSESKADLIRINAMRGDGMRGIDHNETDFLKAIKFLDNKEPKQALEILQKLYQITDNFIYYEDVRWYLALTELKLHNKSEAKKYLNELLESELYSEKAIKVLEEL